MLVKHIAANDKVFIQVDSDCDGLTSSAILINYLNYWCPSFAQNNIQYRMHEGKQHGIILDTIPEDVKLVIAPDSSSNDYEIHQELKERGVDVLVLDHHEADKISSYACVINNQLCAYPTKSLSGAGIVYKFCCYLDEIQKTDYAQNLRDMAALGIIVDVMDLRDFETRELVAQGLGNVKNPFFKAMVEKQAFTIGDTLTATGVAWYIGPSINAVMRFGSNADKILLFEAMLNYKAYEQIPSTKRGCHGQTETRVEQACRMCSNTRTHQNKERDAELEVIDKIVKDKNLLNNKILIVCLDKSIKSNRNITGLIANQLMSKYQRPTLLLHETIHEDGDIKETWWEGSGRAYDKCDLKNFRSFCLDQGCGYA